MRDQRRITRHPPHHLRAQQRPGRRRPEHLTGTGPGLQVGQRDRHVQRRRTGRSTLRPLAVRVQPTGPAAHLGQRLDPPLARRTQVALPGRVVRCRRRQRPDRRLQARGLLGSHPQLVLRHVAGLHPRLRQPRHARQPPLQVVELPRSPVPPQERRAQPAHLRRPEPVPRSSNASVTVRTASGFSIGSNRATSPSAVNANPGDTSRFRHPRPHHAQRGCGSGSRRGIRRQRPTSTGGPCHLDREPGDLAGTALPQRRRELPHPRLRVQPRLRHHTPTYRLRRHLGPHRRRPRRHGIRLGHQHRQLGIRRLVQRHPRNRPSPRWQRPSRSDAPPVPTSCCPCSIITEHLFVSTTCPHPDRRGPATR